MFSVFVFVILITALEANILFLSVQWRFLYKTESVWRKECFTTFIKHKIPFSFLHSKRWGGDFNIHPVSNSRGEINNRAKGGNFGSKLQINLHCHNTLLLTQQILLLINEKKKNTTSKESCSFRIALHYLLTEQLSCVLTVRSFSEPWNYSASSPLSISEYDLVSAYEVDHRGDYVSHDIMHYQRRRRRRAVTQPGGDALHLRLKGPRHDLHLDLKAASNLMAPGFMVQTLGKGGTKSVQMFPPEENCFYQGSLRSQGNSSVALSTCQGLVSTDSTGCPQGMRCQCGGGRNRFLENNVTCPVIAVDISVICDSRWKLLSSSLKYSLLYSLVNRMMFALTVWCSKKTTNL